jgi:ribosomal protein S18 acetylase RimI-like enzyme
MIHIRLGTTTDHATLVEFNKKLAFETEGLTLEHEVISSGVHRALNSKGLSQYFVAVVDDEIVGQLMITPEVSDWRDGVIWWIQSVYVAQSWRGKGVYRELYENIVHEASKSADVRAIRLYVEENNHAAIKTYKKLGMLTSHYQVMETCLKKDQK